MANAAETAHAHDVAHGKAPHAHIPRVAIITCSDTRSMKEDTAGAALVELV